MNPQADDPTPAAALFLVNNGPAAWRAMLAEHLPDAGGHCAGCSSTVLASPVWPCSLRAIAEAAQRLAAARGTPGGSRA